MWRLGYKPSGLAANNSAVLVLIGRSAAHADCTHDVAVSISAQDTAWHGDEVNFVMRSDGSHGDKLGKPIWQILVFDGARVAVRADRSLPT